MTEETKQSFFRDKGERMRGYLWLMVSFILPFIAGPVLWETNDDVAISMYAHGYGVGTEPSHHLIFSNYLWGMLVGSLPELGGTPGYTLGLFLVLFLSGLCIFFSLRSVGKSPILSSFVVLLCLVRPISFPQFTVTAGLAAAAGILGIYTYLKSGARNQRLLWLAIVMVICAELIRPREAMLIFSVAAPLFLVFYFKTRALFFKVAAAAVLSLGLFALVDKLAYSGENWDFFKRMDSARTQFTDYRVGRTLEKKPDILAQFGLNLNDLALIENWYFVDQRISSPEILEGLVREVPTDWKLRFQLGEKSLEMFFGGQLLYYLIGIGLLLLYCEQRNLWLLGSAAILVAFVFLLGVLAKPAPERVTLPLVLLVFLFSCLQFRKESRWELGVVGLVVLILCWENFKDTKELRQIVVENIKDARVLSENEMTVVWASALPYELLYTPFNLAPEVKRLKIYGLAASAFLPQAIQQMKIAGHSDFVAWLGSADAVPLVATEAFIRSLSDYCKRWMPSELKVLEKKQLSHFSLYRVTCH